MFWIFIGLIIAANIFIIIECINAPVYDDDYNPIEKQNKKTKKL